MKIGDLHLKKGDKQKAIEAYSQVAQQFSKGGFDAKAVAIFKQILRVDSECLEARIQLGDHFQRMGLASDALREFQIAVKFCQANDLKREAFDQLKKVALLDPGNIPNRLNLASLMLRQGLEDDAQQEFGLLLKEVARHTSAEMATRVAEATLDAFPTHKEALATLAEVKISTGQPKKAIELLKQALPSFGDDIEFHEVLVMAYEADGDSEGVRGVYRRIAEIYKNRGEPDTARDILQRHVSAEPLLDTEGETSPSILLTEEEEPPAPPKSEDPLTLAADELLDQGGQVIGDGAPLDAALGQSIRSSVPLFNASDLLAEAKVSLEFGDAEEAERLVQQVLRLEPSSTEAKELLARIEAPEEVALEVEAEPLAGPAVQPRLEPLAEPPLEDVLEEESLETLPDIELVLDDEEDRDDAFASIDPPRGIERAPPPSAEPDDEEIEIDIELDEEPGELEVSSAPAGRATDSHVFGAEDWSAESARVSEDLEEAEFFLEQGMIPEAERILREVLARSPNHPKAMLRLGEILSERGETVTCGVTDLLGDTHVDEAESPVEAPPIPEVKLERPKAAPLPRPPSFSERTFPDATEETLEDLLADAEAAVAAVEPEPEDDFDLAAELEDEDVVLATAEKSGTAFDKVFAAFKKGIQDQVGEEESETHYDLAIAYKEMGLLEDAVRELETVQRAGARPAETLSLMAACKLELGQAAVAATHLGEALAIVGEGADSAISLRYDLGEALLAAGDRVGALDAFKQVAAKKPGFREVADRLQELS